MREGGGRSTGRGERAGLLRNFTSAENLTRKKLKSKERDSYQLKARRSVIEGVEERYCELH